MFEIRRWLILVSLNTPASFAAALATHHTAPRDIIEMILGILTFVLVALGVDAWIKTRGLTDLRASLVTATKVKIGLQLIPAIEVGAGVVAAAVVTDLFNWNPTGPGGHLGRTYLMTIVTGAVLTLFVFLVTAIVFHIRARRTR